MDEFLLQIQAKLDEMKSKGNINSDIDALQSKIDKLKIQAEIDPKTISTITSQLEAILNQKIDITNININSSQAAKDAMQAGQQIGQQINQGISKGLNENINTLDTFRRSLQNIGMGSEEIDAVANRINNLGVQIKSLNQSTSHFVGTQGNKDILTVDISGVDKLGQAIKLTEKYDIATGNLIKSTDSVSTSAKKAGTAIQDTGHKIDSSFKPATQKRINSLANSILLFKNNNTKMSKEVSKALDDMYNHLINGANISDQELKELESTLSKYKLQVREAGDLGKSFGDKLKSNISNFTSWGFATVLATKGLVLLRDMYQSVYDIDTAMTNLYKVTDETDSKYNEFLMDACDNAKKLGRSVSSLIEQTANWAKLGYSIDESKKLAETSSIYANVGEVDDDTAVSDIVTVMKAYNIAADDAISIVDKYNKLGNEFATSSKDLGEGMSNAASMLALGGTDINKALALLTGGAEITQSAGELGNALKIGQMRVQGKFFMPIYC